MHVFAGEIPSLPRSSNRGKLERVGGGEHEGKEQAEKLDDPRPSSELSALSLTVSFLSHLRVAFLSYFSLHQTLSLSLSPHGSLRSYFPFLSPPPANGPSHEWSKEEMCLCLDSRQIICGNKFLCV